MQIKIERLYECCFNNESLFYGKDIILKLADHSNSYDFYNRGISKILYELHTLEDKQNPMILKTWLSVLKNKGFNKMYL